MNVQSAGRVNPYLTPINTGLNTKGARVLTISELYEENGFKRTLDDKIMYRQADNSNIIEVNGEKIDISKLDRISFENLEWEKVPTFEPNVQNGLEYERSCFDFTNMNDIGKLTAKEDFTSMSEAEIYKAIYEKYQHCYGENFYYSRAISYPAAPLEDDYCSVVMHNFNREINAAIKDVTAARREALYGDMSDYEVRQAIIDSYNLEDGMTFRELYQMTYDIWQVGLDGGLHNRLDDLFYDFSTAESRANCDNIATREKYLNIDVSGKYFNELHKFSMLKGILPEYSTTLNQIRAACGASSRGVSVSSVSTAAQNNFQWIKL